MTSQQNMAKQRKIDPAKLDTLLNRLVREVAILNRRMVRVERATLRCHDPDHPLNLAREADDEG